MHAYAAHTQNYTEQFPVHTWSTLRKSTFWEKFDHLLGKLLGEE